MLGWIRHFGLKSDVIVKGFLNTDFADDSDAKMFWLMNLA